jgi:hypothetical protein
MERNAWMGTMDDTVSVKKAGKDSEALVRAKMYYNDWRR